MAKWLHAFNLPLGSLAELSHFQGADVARDPVDGKDYLFQLQANPTGVGDVEDLYIHRYDVSTGQPRYVDTCYGTKFGHIQCVHVRISDQQNPYLWFGMEKYDANGVYTKKELWRTMYRGGQTLTTSSTFTARIPTGPGNIDVIGNDNDWTVVLRRVVTDGELFEWFEENELRAWTSDTVRPTPRRSLLVPRSVTTMQACASNGAYNDSVIRIGRLNGLTEEPSILSETVTDLNEIVRYSTLDITDALPPGSNVTSEEPEAVFWWNGKLYFGKQLNPSGPTRMISYFVLAPWQQAIMGSPGIPDRARR